MRASQHVVSHRNTGSNRPASASSRRRTASRNTGSKNTRPTRPSSSNYTSQHVTKLLVTARRRAYGGSGQGSSGLYSHGTNNNARHTYGNLVRGASSGRQANKGYSSRYGGSYQRPQSAQGGAYRLARQRKQQTNSDTYQKALHHQQQSSQQKMRIAGSASRQGVTGSGTNFSTNYWGGTQQAKNEVAHHHPLLQQNKHNTQPYDGLNKHTSDRWNQRGSSSSAATNKSNQKNSSVGTTNSKKKSTTSPSTTKDSVSRTLSVSSQNNRSNPNAPLIKLTSDGTPVKVGDNKKMVKKTTTTTTKVTEKTKTTATTKTNVGTVNTKTTTTTAAQSTAAAAAQQTAKMKAKMKANKTTTVANAVADEAEIAATALIGDGSHSSGTNTSKTSKPPSDFAKMREANR